MWIRSLKQTAHTVWFINQKDEFGRSVEEILEIIYRYAKYYYNIFIKTGDLAGLKEEYERHLANRGERVRIEAQEDSYEATAIGINNRGELIVDADGEERIIRTGEVSVRGIYGYV